MEGSIIDLSKYRMETAWEDLRTAKSDLQNGNLRASINRSYYGIFDKDFSKMIDSAFRLREKADYQDFFVVSVEEAQKQIDKAEKVLSIVEEYVKGKW